MNSIFNVENKFWQFMNKMTDAFLLCLLWVLFSIPILTAGTSFCAMLSVMIRLADDTEGRIGRNYLRAFVRNFRQTTAIWLLQLLFMVILYVDFRICSYMEGNLRTLMLALISAIGAMGITVFTNIYALIGRYKLQIKKACRDGLCMLILNAPSSVNGIFGTLLIVVLMGRIGWQCIVLVVPLLYVQAFLFNRFFKNLTEETVCP